MDYGPGLGFGFAHLLQLIAGGLFAAFLFLVGVGLVFLLVRFLLVATRAAQLYIANNSPAAPAEPAASAAPVTPTTVAPAPTTATATKPATRSPKPKA